MDFVIVKANPQFRDAISPGSVSLDQKNILDFVAASDQEKVSRLKQEVQLERNKRDPAYLIPIHANEVDAIQSVADSDAANLSSGYSSRSDEMTFRLPDGQQRIFPIRVSLARNNVYFVVMSLHVQNLASTPRMETVSPAYMPQSPYQNPVSQGYGRPSQPSFQFGGQRPFSSGSSDSTSAYEASPYMSTYAPHDRGQTKAWTPPHRVDPSLPPVAPWSTATSTPALSMPYPQSEVGRQRRTFDPPQPLPPPPQQLPIGEPTPNLQLPPILNAVSEPPRRRLEPETTTDGGEQNDSDDDPNRRRSKRRRRGKVDIERLVD
jgi:hypothetical protein